MLRQQIAFVATLLYWVCVTSANASFPKALYIILTVSDVLKKNLVLILKVVPKTDNLALGHLDTQLL